MNPLSVRCCRLSRVTLCLGAVRTGPASMIPGPLPWPSLQFRSGKSSLKRLADQTRRSFADTLPEGKVSRATKCAADARREPKKGASVSRPRRSLWERMPERQRRYGCGPAMLQVRKGRGLMRFLHIPGAAGLFMRNRGRRCAPHREAALPPPGLGVRGTGLPRRRSRPRSVRRPRGRSTSSSAAGPAPRPGRPSSCAWRPRCRGR